MIDSGSFVLKQSLEDMFNKKDVLRKFAKFVAPVLEPLFNKVAGLQKRDIGTSIFL